MYLLTIACVLNMVKVTPKNSFLYFAYGSNLLTDRIHVNNPSARKVDVGKLKDYCLGFDYFSQRWKGAAATIMKEKGQHMYGVLWELDDEHMKSLDEQEGVEKGIYEVHPVTVEITNGELVQARSYKIIRPPETDKRPSKVYMDVILKGARENGLPEEYIKYLESIEHNGYSGEVNVNLDLSLVKS
ncbi:unnamed protein product [Meganyctiphanes norvegica]|uniref:gamma-glutamylcyclotransferase n=1 Tax=Meganyctiphanes norvegica TaxID=48144 RepID=A0AAV2QX40_MEGNR